MLYLAAEFLTRFVSGFNLFTYITMRAIMSALTALILSLVLGPGLIRRLTEKKIGQTVRNDGPGSHLPKAGTPTMGGTLILLAIAAGTLLWADLRSHYVWVVLGVTLAYGLIGFVDDYRKLTRRDPKGLSARAKFTGQLLVALAAAGYLYALADRPQETALLVPYLKNLAIPLGGFYIAFVTLVIVGTSNAVNLTDGLDGLATMPAVLVGGALGVFAYAAGNVIYSRYLGIPYVAGAGEMLVFCSALAGAGLGFLWFNAYPAQIFMGDTGSLSIGGSLAVASVLLKQELLFVILGGLFVAEAFTSQVQDKIGIKLLGRRIFSRAPLHHAMAWNGLAETKVVVRLWIVSGILALAALATLKLR